MPVLIGRNRVAEHLHGQRRDRLRQLRGEKPVIERREQQRRRFARNARERQHDAGDNAGKGGRQDDREDGARARRAERERALAHRFRDQQQQLFGRPRDNRNHHDAEGDPSGDGAELLERQDGNPVDEHADDDRRDAVQGVGGKAHQRSEPRPRVFRRVDPAQHADWHRHQRSKAHQDERARDRVRHAAARLAHRLRHVREELEVEGLDALADDKKEDERQRDQREQHGARAERDEDRGPRLAAAAAGCHATASAGVAAAGAGAVLALRAMLQISRRERELTIKVMTKSTRPISISASR